MVDKFGQFENDFSGGSDVWDDGLAGSILLADYFDAVPTDTVYKGASWAAYYLGTRSDAALYLGAGTLR